MKKLLILLLFPLMMFAQESTLIGDVNCDGEITSQDASLILQFITNNIEELPCEANMTGLTPEQLQEMINMLDEQLGVSGGGGSEQTITMIGPMYKTEDFPEFIHFNTILIETDPETSVENHNLYWIDAMLFCGELEYNGYSDWFIPSLNQIMHYHSENGSIIIDNYSEIDLSPMNFWTNTTTMNWGNGGTDHRYRQFIQLYNSNFETTGWSGSAVETVNLGHRILNFDGSNINTPKGCFCVR